VSTLLHGTVYVFTQFAECTSTNCKKNYITKKIESAKRKEGMKERMKKGKERIKKECILKQDCKTIQHKLNASLEKDL
jgi:hypothetical protein